MKLRFPLDLDGLVRLDNFIHAVFQFLKGRSRKTLLECDGKILVPHGVEKSRELPVGTTDKMDHLPNLKQNNRPQDDVIEKEALIAEDEGEGQRSRHQQQHAEKDEEGEATHKSVGVLKCWSAEVVLRLRLEI